MILVKGSTGSRVKEIQQALEDKGFDPGEIDGDFGPGTEAAVIAFQKSEGLLPDGKVGPNTLKGTSKNTDFSGGGNVISRVLAS